MAVFKYTAFDRSGKVKTGVIEKPSINVVSDWLLGEELTPVNIVETKKNQLSDLKNENTSGSKNRLLILTFTRELSVMLSSGLSLDRSLGILDGLYVGKGKELVNDIRSKVREGKALSEAFSHRKEFSSFYISMVRAGEASGSLELSLKRMADYLESSQALRQMVSSAMTYPLILLVVAIISLVFLLAYVVPSFADLFNDMGGSLPGPTRFVMNLGEFMGSWWYLVLAFILGIYKLLVVLLKRDSIKVKLDKHVLTWPIIGDLVRNLETSRFSKTLSVLMEGGVPLVNALEIARGTINNKELGSTINRAISDLKEGKSLSSALINEGKFPRLAVQMMQVGEETGHLEEILSKISQIYENQVEITIKRLLSLLEPVLILSLGVLISGIIVSILLGILGVNDLIG